MYYEITCVVIKNKKITDGSELLSYDMFTNENSHSHGRELIVTKRPFCLTCRPNGIILVSRFQFRLLLLFADARFGRLVCLYCFCAGFGRLVCLRRFPFIFIIIATLFLSAISSSLSVATTCVWLCYEHTLVVVHYKHTQISRASM